ncbi:MAG: hypothetical protein C5B51_14100 [Terriglobia bacterium]|nr:MAG: hypothetical protein C5B51_14100 [Terriglobia bacterium]
MPITSEYLIVGEGGGDSALIKYLCENRQITYFQIEDSGGSSKFESYITGLRSRRGFDKLKLLVIVADCDDGADVAFNNIRRQLRNADLPYPNGPRSFARRPDRPATFVIMLPFNGNQSLTGSIETLLLPAAKAHHPNHIWCLEQWRDCVDAQAQSAAHRDKMQLRALLAAIHPSDPNISLQWALRPQADLIPLSHQSLDALADVLKQIPQAFETSS